MDLFRLVLYRTKEEDKFNTEDIHEYLGNRKAIRALYTELATNCGYKHVEVYDTHGGLCDMTKGIHEMNIYQY
jgi:hypothetical protein